MVVRIDHQIDIAAPPEEVWRLTEDIESWPSFTPTITAIERLEDGPLAEGSRVQVKQPGQPTAVWTVTRVEAPTVFEWQRPFLGLMMTAFHRVESTDAGSCRNHLAIELAGFGAGFIGVLVRKGIHHALVAENHAFKQQAETERPTQG